MGLYASVDIFSDLQFIATTPVLGLTPDYNPGCAIFCSVFEKVAKELCPVDTGNLQQSLTADTDGMTYCEAITNCEYAQYQEYGTWCMPAQPYFEIALETAINTAFDTWKQAETEVFEEEQKILGEIRQGFLQSASGFYREADNNENKAKQNERQAESWHSRAEQTGAQIDRLIEQANNLQRNASRKTEADCDYVQAKTYALKVRIEQLMEQQAEEIGQAISYTIEAFICQLLAVMLDYLGDRDTQMAQAVQGTISVSEQIQKYGGMFSPPTTLIS